LLDSGPGFHRNDESFPTWISPGCSSPGMTMM
jgi:hypothetical protein